jgi:putative toxin-antitoxin system antitoxin component (TIGR02293 family)
MLEHAFTQSSDIWSIVIPELTSSEIPDSIKIIRAIRNGLPGTALGKIAEVYQMPITEMYGILHISPKNGQRLVSKKLDKNISDHLVQMVKVFCRTYEIFKSFDKTVRWLKTPCYALGNQVPVQLLDTTVGTELVMNTLRCIEYGVFS